MTDMTVKTRKSFLRTCARTYAGKSFIHYPSYPSSVTKKKIRNSNRRNSKKQRKVSCVRAHVRVKFYKNYCYYCYYCYCYQEVYEKQVHPFDKTGACIWVIRCTHLGKQVHPFSARLDLQSNRNEYKHF